MKTILLTGSNLGDRHHHMNRARTLIASTGKILKISDVYETEPWGVDSPVPFLNQALLVETSLSAEKMMQELLTIEKEMGRVRTNKRYAPRTIDIDLLFFGQEIIKTPFLMVPHPKLHLRRFALLPASQISPQWNHPVFNMNLKQLLNICEDKKKVLPVT